MTFTRTDLLVLISLEIKHITPTFISYSFLMLLSARGQARFAMYTGHTYMLTNISCSYEPLAHKMSLHLSQGPSDSNPKGEKSTLRVTVVPSLPGVSNVSEEPLKQRAVGRNFD